MKKGILFILTIILAVPASAQSQKRLQEQAEKAAAEKSPTAVTLSQRARSQYTAQTVMPEEITWRRDIYRELDLRKEKNEKQRILNLENCIELARKATGIEWVCLGFKATDGLNRRVMLKTYEDGAIFRGGHKFFPLASYTNKWCLKYIEENNLIKPIDYGMSRGVSSEFVPNNTGCLLWVREHYPKDYEKTVKE